MEKQNPQPVCGQEALLLLNCVTESPYDLEKCIRFLQSLRECVLSKVSSLLPLVTDLYESFVSGKVNKFVIPSQEHASEGAGGSATKQPS
uniref:CHCH domain-containing protein n=1 Tax=Brassica campestris TaxID=3711 RepID=M4DRX4_BRACM